MDVDLVVRNPGGDELPVTVTIGPQATGADLRRALAELVGTPDADVSVGGPRPWSLGEAGPLRPADLPSGTTVYVGSPVTTASLPADRSFDVIVAGGLHAGPRAPLGYGEAVTVGRGTTCDLRLPDREVSRVHVRLWVGTGGRATLVDAGSANGTRMGPWRVTGETPLDEHDVVGLGESALAVRRVSPDQAEITVDAESGLRLVNRPPRIVGPARPVELVVPVKPVAPRGFRFPWLATLAPAALGGVLFLVLPSGYGVYMLAMLALSPLMAVVNLVSDRRAGRHEHAAALAAYVRSKNAFEAELATAVREDVVADRLSHPDPGEITRRARGPAASLWERRRGDDDFLRLRLGLADRPARVVLRADPAVELPDAHDVAVTVDVTAVGVLGLAGPRPMTLAAARAAVAQAAVLHSPAELGLVVITGRDGAADWEWATWLPHTIPASATFACRRLVATDAGQAEARLAELRRLVEERAAERRGAPTGRALLVMVDGARRLRHLSGLPELLATGPAVGVHAICLDDDESALPDECGATLVATSGTRATVRRRGLSAVEGVLVDGLVAAEATALARALAPLRPHGERAGDSTLPDTVRFVELARPFTREGWDRSTEVLLGIGPDGPVRVDLRRDGPHALVAGTSGSGKSELLQTLVASLALGNRPDGLTFVLVDYKGGSAFAACADLPHCVGLVTDLDGHLVNRALDSLSAELRRREHLFADAGAKDIEDYWARTGRRLPRLVIVVDEFASLVEELPEFVPGVVGIGMRGRSLGVHIVLATQRPGGVVTADMRANLNLRISLRVTAAAESSDVVDAPDAARIAPGQPGRAYLRTGHGELTAFQTARVGVPIAPVVEPAPVVAVPRRVEALGQSRVRLEPATADVRTDLTELVEVMRAAAADLEPPTRPWLPPLPTLITLSDVGESKGPLLTESDYKGPFLTRGAGAVVAAVIGLVDRPRSQSQEPFVVDLERTGPIVVAGAVRAGRATTLRTLAAALVAEASPADVHLYGIDCGNRALEPLAGLPHCGAVVAGDDAGRLERLLELLHAEVARRQRAFAAGGHASLAEQRRGPDPQPYLVVLLDRLESFLVRYGEVDGGRLVDRVESLLRTGPAVGVTMVISTDRTGFHHRVSSAVAARLVLRQATVDDAAAFGLDPRRVPRQMVPGRGIWATTGEEVQVAVLDPDPSGAAQANAVNRLAAELRARWDGHPGGPRRLDPLPDVITADEAERLRPQVKPQGVWCTPVVGGDHLAPVDVDLSDGGFLIAGPARSGRSTALVAIAATLDQNLLVVAPRPSPLRDLPGVLGVVSPDELPDIVANAGPLVLIVDDAELVTDPAATDALEVFARSARDRGAVLVAAATTEDLLANSYRGWLATLRRTRTGLLLNPTSHVDGEVFGLRLPRSVRGGQPPGRGLLVVRGEAGPAQVIQPATAALR